LVNLCGSKRFLLGEEQFSSSYDQISEASLGPTSLKAKAIVITRSFTIKKLHKFL